LRKRTNSTLKGGTKKRLAGWLAGYWASTQDVIGDEEVKIEVTFTCSKEKKKECI